MVTVEEVKPQGYDWWFAELDPTGFARRVQSEASETNSFRDIALASSVDLYPAIVVGHNGVDKIVIGYIGYYVDNDGTDHYVIPNTGQPYEWIVFVDTSYRKYYGNIIDNGDIEIYGKAHGLLIVLNNDKLYTVPFNIICGGLCISALVAIAATALGTAATIKFWSDAKKAEAAKAEANAIVEAEKIRWNAIQSICERDPQLCHTWGGAVVASSSSTMTSLAITQNNDSGIMDIVKTFMNTIAPLFIPIIGAIIVVLKWKLIIDILTSMFRRR